MVRHHNCDFTTQHGYGDAYDFDGDRKQVLIEAAKEAREMARTDATDENLNDLVCAVEFQDAQKQAEWLEWLEDDSEINQARLCDYVSTEFYEMYRLLTKKARAYFDEFELDYIF